MFTKSLKAAAALALVGSTSFLTLASAPAKADLFCYPWESNCKADGKIGTSGNDILGLPGGDTVQKAAMAADTYFGTSGAITKTVNTVYEPNKRRILDPLSTQVKKTLSSTTASPRSTQTPYGLNPSTPRILRPISALPSQVNLSGTWRANNGGVYNVRQNGNNISWLGQGSNWRNTFNGAIAGNQIQGYWQDAATSQTQNAGQMTLRIDSNNRMTLIRRTGAGSATIWYR